MEELRFSIDEEKYDDRHGQVLSLGGWYAGSDRQEMSFCLVGDGNQELVPVSYTHLDVYKRQGTDSGSGNRRKYFRYTDSTGRSGNTGIGN